MTTAEIEKMNPKMNLVKFGRVNGTTIRAIEEKWKGFLIVTFSVVTGRVLKTEGDVDGFPLNEIPNYIL